MDLAVERELWEMNSVNVVPVVIGAPGTTVEPRLMATSVIRSPCYFGLFFLARQNGPTFSYRESWLMWSPVNTANGHNFKNLQQDNKEK